MPHYRIALALGAVLALAAAPASADPRRRKYDRPMRLAAGPGAVSQDFGNIAVLVDNGLMVTSHSLPDLSGIAIRFAPVGDHLFSVSRSPAVPDPVYGPELTFGLPGVPYPGDDDSQEIAFPAGFPWFGTTWPSVWVNTDGNLTFGAPDFASSNRDKARHVLGPPRVSAFLNDWSPLNAFNPAGGGSVHAAVKTGPDRLVVTWNGVLDYAFGGTSTFQVILYASGAVELVLARIDPLATYGVTGIAEGAGRGVPRQLDFASMSQPETLAAGSLLEAFAAFTWVNDQEVAREFYRTHPDKFDFLVTFTNFPVDAFMHSNNVSNQTHGIGTPLSSGQPIYPDTVYDFTAEYGSAGELEQFVFMNNITANWSDAERMENPPVVPYDSNVNVFVNPGEFGQPVTLDGQTMAQVRLAGILPSDNGEWSRYFARGGIFSPWLNSICSGLAHEVFHRYGPYPRFVHPTKGGDGLDSYDLLGRQIAHWSWFVNTALPATQFGGAPRFSTMEGNAIVDLGPIASWNGVPTNLAPGERVFRTQPDELADGFSELDQYLMGLRRAGEVSPFFYVDEPRSIYTGQDLDVVDPQNPLNTYLSMRAWQPQAGIVLKGKRVDLTVENIQDFEKTRERQQNPQGRRFWGPKGNLAVRYFSDSRRVDPAGDARIVLSTADRELGDEADRIGVDGKPIDVKTLAFILLVGSGSHPQQQRAIDHVDLLRRTWQDYANGPASGGRGRFDTSLDPAVY
jgi:hypothetical protein